MTKNLVFVHGFFGDSAGLAPLLSFFDPKKYHIFTPDLPPSHQHYLTKYTADTYTDYLKKYLIKHQIENPILIGHSMGSIIVSAFAQKYPNLIDKKVILLAPISRRPGLFFRILQPFIVLLPVAITNFLTTVFLSYPKNIKQIKLNLKHTLPSAKTNKKRLHILKSAIFSCSTSVKDFSPTQQFLLINGDKENLVNSSDTKVIQKNLTNAILITIKNTGHLLQLEQPKQVANTINKFIQ